MNKKIFVLMMVGMFLLVTFQTISAVETESGDTASKDAEITSEPSKEDTAKVFGYIIPSFAFKPVRIEALTESHSGDPVVLYSGLTWTDWDGYYQFEDVPVGLDCEFEVSCKFIKIFLLAPFSGCYIDYEGYEYFKIPEPGHYRVDIKLDEKVYPVPFSQTEGNIQNQQISEQQIKSIS